MKPQDLMQAFSAVDPHFRSEAQQIAARTNRRRRIRRTVTRIAAGLTAAAAACGGLLALGVYLQAHDGINVQTTGYPIEEVHETTAGTQLTTTLTADSTERETTADSTEATDDAALFEGIMHGTTPYILPFCEDGTLEDNTPTSEVTGTEAAAVQTVRAAETTAMPAVTAAQTTAETAAAVQTTVQTEQQTAAETEPQTYQPGDIDMDGHLTYADYMLAWMYQYYLTLPETTGSYPQMLNAAQIAIYNDIDTIEIDMSQYFDKTLNPSEARAAATPSLKLDAAVTSLMQPTDMSAKASLFAASPEQIRSITDTDFACIQSGCLHGLADHAYLLGQYYLCQLLPEKYGQRSTSITAEQVDAYLDFLREACIAREKQLST